MQKNLFAAKNGIFCIGENSAVPWGRRKFLLQGFQDGTKNKILSG
jgi:hypothetical protein